MRAGTGWQIALRLLESGPRCGHGLRLLPGGNKERVCTTCGESKPLYRFEQNGRDPNGALRFKTQCRECVLKRDLASKKVRKARKQQAEAGACHA